MPKQKQKKRFRGDNLPSGSYRVRLYIGNGKYKSFTAATRDEAELLAQKYVVDHRIYNADDIGNMTFGEAIKDYIEVRTNTRSTTTILKYRSMIPQFEPLINMKLRNIDNTVMMRFVNNLSLTHKQKTVDDYKNLAISVIKEKIPSAVFRVNTGLVAEKTEEEELENMPNDFQLRTLIHNAEPKTRLCIFLGAFCMMREGEISALNKSHFDGNIITIVEGMKRDLDKNWYIDRTKTKKIRKVIAPSFVVDAFMELPTNTIELTPKAISSRYSRLCKKLGFDKLTFHGLRKFGASSWTLENISDEYIKKAGGWSSDKVMKKHYIKVFDDAQTEAFNHMNEVFECYKNI